MKKLALSALVLSSTLIAAPSFAYEKGDVIVRVGAAHVDVNTTNNTIQPGLDVDDATAVGITGTYMLSDHVGVELLASTPFKHDIELNGATVGDAKQLPPTLSLQYYPMDSASKVQPFVGVGLNYTTFFSEGSSLGNVELEDSWGLAAQVGIDYALDDKWLLNATVWHIDIDTDVELNGADLGQFDVDPTVFLLSVGYRF